MTEHAQHDLGYGQLGRTIYDAEGHTWLAQREPSASSGLIPLQEEEDTTDATANVSRSRLYAPERAHTIRELADAFPVLLPARLEIAKNLADEVDPGDNEEALKGSLLEFISNVPNMKRRIRLLAVGGLENDSVRFFELRTKRLGWDDKSAGQLEGLHIDDRTPTSWTTEGRKVLQICCADVGDRAGNLTPLVGVRTPSSIHILRLGYGESGLDYATGRKPRIAKRGAVKAQRIAVIEPTLEHGVSFVDLSFDPRNDDQIAAVTTTGKWFVFVVASFSKESADLKKPLKLLLTNDFYSGDALDLDTTLGHPKIQDGSGWHNILWFLDGHHVVICSRSQLKLLHISGKVMGRWSPGPGASTSWITSMQRSTLHNDEIYLASTTTVYRLRFLDHPGEVDIVVLASWRHYRDVTDVHLRLRIFERPEGETILLLSRRDPLITEYLISSSEAEPSRSLRSDASKLLMPCNGILGLAISAVRHVAKGYDDLEADDVSEDSPYLQMFATGRDLVPFERLYCRFNDWRRHHVYTMARPTWQRVSKRAAPRSTITIRDRFIIRDNDYSSDAEEDRDSSEPSLSRFRDDAFTIPNEEVYAAISRSGASKDGDLAKALASVLDVADTREDSSTMQTLDQLLTDSYRVADIEAASSTIEELGRPLSQPVDAHRRNIKAIAAPGILGLSSLVPNDRMSLTDTYSRLASYWLRPLPTNTPARARLEKEGMVRRVAASIVLSSHAVDPRVEADPANFSQDISEADPSLPMSGVQSQSPSQSQSQSPSQLLLSSQIASSQPTLDNPLPTTVSFGTLTRYTVLNHAPTNPPRRLHRVLAHWTVGSDPATYDFMTTSAAVEEADANANLSGHEKQTRMRSIERKRKREASSQHRRASRDAGLISSSQIHADGDELLSSSQAQATPVSSPRRSQALRVFEPVELPSPSKRAGSTMPLTISSPTRANLKPAMPAVEGSQNMANSQTQGGAQALASSRQVYPPPSQLYPPASQTHTQVQSQYLPSSQPYPVSQNQHLAFRGRGGRAREKKKPGFG